MGMTQNNYPDILFWWVVKDLSEVEIHRNQAAPYRLTGPCYNFVFGTLEGFFCNSGHPIASQGKWLTPTRIGVLIEFEMEH
jgi:hypothetical protein